MPKAGNSAVTGLVSGPVTSNVLGGSFMKSGTSKTAVCVPGLSVTRVPDGATGPCFFPSR